MSVLVPENVSITKHRIGESEVYIMDTSMIDTCLLAHHLPALMLNQAMTSFKSQTRQKEWLCTRLLLKFIEGDNAIIEYSSNGAPILLNSDKHISISHSGNFVAIALSKHQVGLDVQVINDKPLRLKSRFLSNQELTLLKSDKDVEGAVKLWCAKEAVYKYVSQPGTELIRDIVLEVVDKELMELLRHLHIRFLQHKNLMVVIAEK